MRNCILDKAELMATFQGTGNRQKRKPTKKETIPLRDRMEELENDKQYLLRADDMQMRLKAALNADPDVPILKQAKAEYAKLQ